MHQLDAKALVFFDETGVNIAMPRQDARAPKGQRLQPSAPVNKGKTLTVWGALALDGILAAMTIAGRTDTAVFLTVGPTIRVPPWRPGQSVILENLSSHQVPGVKEAIASAQATLEYVPADSPDWSPREEGWSKLKALLRAKAARTRERLDQAITEALAIITPQDAQGWFAHCGYL
jgi:transposase